MYEKMFSDPIFTLLGIFNTFSLLSIVSLSLVSVSLRKYKNIFLFKSEIFIFLVSLSFLSLTVLKLYQDFFGIELVNLNYIFMFSLPMLYLSYISSIEVLLESILKAFYITFVIFFLLILVTGNLVFGLIFYLTLILGTFLYNGVSGNIILFKNPFYYLSLLVHIVGGIAGYLCVIQYNAISSVLVMVFSIFFFSIFIYSDFVVYSETERTVKEYENFIYRVSEIVAFSEQIIKISEDPSKNFRAINESLARTVDMCYSRVSELGNEVSRIISVMSVVVHLLKSSKLKLAEIRDIIYNLKENLSKTTKVAENIEKLYFDQALEISQNLSLRNRNISDIISNILTYIMETQNFLDKLSENKEILSKLSSKLRYNLSLLEYVAIDGFIESVDERELTSFLSQIKSLSKDVKDFTYSIGENMERSEEVFSRIKDFLNILKELVYDVENSFRYNQSSLNSILSSATDIKKHISYISDNFYEVASAMGYDQVVTINFFERLGGILEDIDNLVFSLEGELSQSERFLEDSTHIYRLASTFGEILKYLENTISSMKPDVNLLMLYLRDIAKMMKQFEKETYLERI